MLYRFLVFFVFFGLFVHSAVNLDKFCHSHYLNKLSEKQPIYNIYNTTCTVTLPFGGVGEVQAGQICVYYSPFRPISAKSNEESTECVYKSNIVCPSSEDHVISGKCIRIVYEKTNFANAVKKCEALKGDNPSSSGYKLLKIQDEHMARWATVFDDLLTRSKGVWINQSSKTDSEDEGTKYLNLELDLWKGKEISSILFGTGNEDYFTACEAIKTETFPDPVDPSAPKRYFLSTNLYHPSDFLKEDSDGLKEMDAVCKKINANSMLALGKPVGLNTKDPVYVSVRATPNYVVFNKPSKCGVNDEEHVTHRNHFDGIIHPVGANVKKSGVSINDWAPKYPMNDCSDVARTAVVFYEKGLIENSANWTLSRKQEGLKVANPCGKGTLGPNGKCECNTGAVDITAMEELAEASNYIPGELCVSENPCDDVHHVILFVMDASVRTHSAETFAGLKLFVSQARDLIGHNNDVGFVAYGDFTREAILKRGWKDADYDQAIAQTLSVLAGHHTNIGGGLEKARELIQQMGSKKEERILIHVGDGKATGSRRDEQEQYDKLSALVSRYIAVAVARFGYDHFHHWHTPGDYVDFIAKKYHELDLNNMKFLIDKVCKQQTLSQLIQSV